MRWSHAVLALVTTLSFGPLAHARDGAADFHPEKASFRDLASWPTTSPGELKLKHFRPFRAVYDRSYTQGSGPGKGQPRHDEVIVTAEEVGWDGRRAIAISVIDSGAAEHADTNARVLFMVVDYDELSLLFEAGPIPGKAKDYYFVRREDGDLLVSQVMTGTQELTPQKVPDAAAGFGPGSWAMASMDLKPGARIRLDPYYSPQANPISLSSYGRVLGEKTIEDAAGNPHRSWVVETSGWYGPSSPKALRLHLDDHPPYLLGIETYDHDADEAKRFVWLHEVRFSAPGSR